jgi:hypothetical protein
MPSTLFGLPTHAMVVHAAVVLIPLAALAVVLHAFWPAARRRLGVGTPILAGIALILTPLATSSGDDLEHMVGENALVRKHAELADGLLPWVFGLFVVALALWLLGMKNPLLWGGVAALFNFAPYVGPLLTLIVLGVAGFSEALTPLQALAVPGVFLLLHIVESWLFTPLFVGRRLALDPVVTFVSLLALGAMWGVAGLLLAMPLLTCVKIVAERVPQLATLAQMLSASQGTLVYSHNPSVASEASE